jgi:prophage antirepressor-like protein
MAGIIPFGFEDHLIRVVMRDGDPWFVAGDVCRVLDIKNPTQATQNRDQDEYAMFNIGKSNADHASRGNPNVLIVSEGGLYTLVLRSRAPPPPP